MKKTLRITSPNRETIQRLRRSLSCSDVLATLLTNRNISSTDQARRFLAGGVTDLPAPDTISDMEPAVDRIYQALRKKEKILVFGDYDADGITATAALTQFLRRARATVTPYIPHRILEGYGLQPEHISGYAKKQGIDLILTVDCGSSSHQAAEACHTSGIDLIITDHHQIRPPYPAAAAVVNPSRPDCHSGLEELAGVGVVFYLLIALRAYLREKKFWRDIPEPNLKQFCDFVAIGTVADMVPLTKTNRILVKTGLEVINTDSCPGLAALKSAAKRKLPVNAEDIAFVLAPRLNAPGRLDHGRLALDLLLAEDHEKARQLADILNKLNTKRQLMEQDIADDIVRIVGPDSEPVRQNRSLILASRGWHQGVIGIAASKTVRRYGVPVALIAINGDMGIGSARSVPELDLYACLRECAHLFESFGGHTRAAGFTIRTTNIPRLEKEFAYAVKRHAGSQRFISETIIDCELPFAHISESLLKEIESMQPFGEKNSEPLFLAKNIRVVSSFLIKQQHRKMVLSQPATAPDKTINAICFHIPPQMNDTQQFHHIVFRLRRDTWNGNRAPQLIIDRLDTEPPNIEGDKKNAGLRI